MSLSRRIRRDRFGVRRASVVAVASLGLMFATPVTAYASGLADATLLCSSTPDPVRCAETESRIWTAATELAATLGPAALPDLCGAAACTLRATVAASLATENPGGVTCTLGATCDLLPAIQQMRANGHGADSAHAAAYGSLDGVVAAGIGRDITPPTVDELMVLIAWMSGTPPLPEGIVDLRTLAASRNLAAFQARAYTTPPGTSYTVSTDPTGSDDTIDVQSSWTRAGSPSTEITVGVPPGCTASFIFGTPWFFKDKNTWDFNINFHYGQHLDSFVIVDERRGGPFNPCPPTQATIKMEVEGGHRLVPALGDWTAMNEQGWSRQVTVYSDRPYVNCYDPRLCNVVQIYADDQRSVLDLHLWGMGEYLVDLYHTWDLSHGYNDHIYPDGNGDDHTLDDGYIGDSYNQKCRWLAGSEALVPEACEGDG